MGATKTPVLRRAAAGESAYLAHTSHRAFREGTEEGWEAYFREHPGVRDGETVVAELDGHRVGNATARRLTMALAGRDVTRWGVAAVSVLPEHRRGGVAGAMMRELLGGLRARGEALSLLHAFRPSYYRRFGYALCERSEQLRARPSQFPSSELRAGVAEFVPARDLAVLRDLYDRSRAGRTGPLARDDWWWDARALRTAAEGVLFRDPETGVAEGYLLWRAPESPGYPLRELHVREMVALTPRAHAGLLGHLAAQGDFYAMITVWGAPGSWLPWLVDQGVVDAPVAWLRHDPIAVAHMGMMGRLVDVAAALRLHPSASATELDTAFGLDVDDPGCGDVQRVDVRLRPDTIACEPGTSCEERVEVGVAALAQLYLGAVDVAALRACGALRGSERAARSLARACAGPPLALGALDAF